MSFGGSQNLKIVALMRKSSVSDGCRVYDFMSLRNDRLDLVRLSNLEAKKESKCTKNCKLYIGYI